MANAPQPASIKTEQGKTNFGGAPVDANRVAMFTDGSWFQTQDATPGGTNLVSPLSNASATAVTTLVVPPNSISITISPTVACSVSEVSGTSSLSQYYTVPANTPTTFQVARQNYVYILPSNATNIINFYFTTV